VAALPRGSETILLVEDDAKVRRLVRQTIERQGYSVLEASSGAAALAVAEQSDSIHLLLTDIVMPEMSGAELATQLATARPRLKVLYMSGYTEHATTLRHHLVSGATLLLKPFTPEELARRVRDALDTRLPA
jgi:CheY-like chemotaxis protein